MTFVQATFVLATFVHIRNSSGIAQLLLTRFSPNFKGRLIGPSLDNCHFDICPCINCQGDNLRAWLEVPPQKFNLRDILGKKRVKIHVGYKKCLVKKQAWVYSQKEMAQTKDFARREMEAKPFMIHARWFIKVSHYAGTPGHFIQATL